MIDWFTTLPQNRYSKRHLNSMEYQFQKTTNYCPIVDLSSFPIINPELTGTSSNDLSCYLKPLFSFFTVVFSLVFKKLRNR